MKKNQKLKILCLTPFKTTPFCVVTHKLLTLKKNMPSSSYMLLGWVGWDILVQCRWIVSAPVRSLAGPRFECRSSTLGNSVITRVYNRNNLNSRQRKLLWYFNAARRCNRKSSKKFRRSEILHTPPVGTVSNILRMLETFILLSW
jgi:hypothetical protein